MAEEKDNKATEAEGTEAKASAKKPAAKKPAAKKPAAKAEATDAKAEDAGAKKPAAKKPAAKTTAAKKPAAKKPAAKKDADDAKADQADAKAPAKKASTSTRRKPATEEILEPVFVRATARYVRSSPRKARLVVDHIRNQSVDDARVFLQFTARHVGRDVAKVLESAVANAEHNHELDADNLHIVKAYVDEGPTLKRWRPRAKGRATQILKRTSHITVVVSNASAKELSSKRKAVA